MKLLFLVAACWVMAMPADAKEVAQLKVGHTIPDVAVKTAEGKSLSLRDAVKSNPAVLIFYRGGWCPYCMKHLQALMEIEDDLKKAGYQILAISADQPKKIAETPKRDELNYQLLSDSSMEAAKAFGITFKVPDDLVTKYKNDYQIDIEAASGESHHVLPHPAVYLVDRQGVVRFAHVNPNYKVRLDPKAIMKAVSTAEK